MTPPPAERFLPFRTERLVLRAFRAADAAVLAAYRNDPDVARYQDWALPVTEAAAAEFVAAQAAVTGPVPGDWVQIALDLDGDLVGDVAVGLDGSGTMAMIGYTLRRDRQGRGFATEAATALVDRIFAVARVRRVSATLDPANVASARLLERLGFRYEGRALAIADVRGEWADDDRYALLRSDREAWSARPTAAPGDVRLRELTIDDLAAVDALSVHHSQEGLGGTPTGALAVASLAGQVEGEPAAWVRGIEAAGVLVGIVVVLVPRPSRTARGRAVLLRLLVDRWHQRRGIGRAAVGLVVAALAEDRDARITELRAAWPAGRGEPGRFFRAAGFVETGTADGVTSAALTLGGPSV